MSLRYSSGILAALWLLISPALAKAHEIIQHFPANRSVSEAKTQWRVVWEIERVGDSSEVLVIKAAHFKRHPKEPWIKVLGDCRLAEIFVPYNDGGRIYDISGHRFSLCPLDRTAFGPVCISEPALYDRNGHEVLNGKAPKNDKITLLDKIDTLEKFKVGEFTAQQGGFGPGRKGRKDTPLTKNSNGPTGTVVKELHDDHLRWMNGRDKVRRGQTMHLWAVLNAANYRYIMMYQFRDDGMVSFRMGATAHNLQRKKSDGSTHFHMGVWRINVPINHATQTQISTVEWDSEKRKTVITPLTKEARLKWDAERFTRLRIESQVEKNNHAPASPVSYDVIPQRMGSPRFRGQGEEFTLFDFWVTLARFNELRVRDLPRYERSSPLANRQLRIWHMSTAMHTASDEDFGEADSKPGSEADTYKGVALVSWCGFDLRPRNLFASTPLYP